MDMVSIFLMGPMGTQAFWIWLTLGILLLGVEVFLGTQWLLWSAASAGVVAVVCLTGLPFGIVAQIVTFALLSLGMSLLTRKFMRVPDGGPDVNAPNSRLLGKQAEVLSGFEFVAGGERTGRVSFEGVEWPAVLTAGTENAVLNAADRVVIADVQEGRLFVTPAA
jgi:inner membrane protein